MNSRKDIKDKVVRRLSRGNDDWLRDLANSYSDDAEHAERILSYFEREWFFVSSPIAANLIKTNCEFTGCPISCYLISASKDLEKWPELERECIYISETGGGIGIDFSDCHFDGVVDKIRELATKINSISNLTRYKSSMAAYLRVDHPQIEDFIHMRDTRHHEDPKRFVHHAVSLTDKFMQAAINDEPWTLVDSDGNPVKTLPSARNLFRDIMYLRVTSGEPYIFFIDNANKNSPECYKKLNLPIKTSNLCTEICLPTNDELTAICCLCSVNVLRYDDWKGNTEFIEDMVRFMDNVITYFITEGPRRKIGDTLQYDSPYIARSLLGKEWESVRLAEEIDHPLKKCFRAAYYGRDIGIGSCGNSSYLQLHNVPMDSPRAMEIFEEIEVFLQRSIDAANIKLAHERGPCPAAADAGMMYRMVNTRAIAPTTMISQFLRCSPCIEPAENVQRVKTGYFVAHEYNDQLIDKLGKYAEDPNLWIRLSNGDLEVLGKYTDQSTVESSVDNQDEDENPGVMDETAQKINPDVFRDPYSTNMEVVIRQTAMRQKYVSQAISLNLFYTSDVALSKLIFHVILAWQLGIKSLYYMRSQAPMRPSDTMGDHFNREVDDDICINCQ